MSPQWFHNAFYSSFLISCVYVVGISPLDSFKEPQICQYLRDHFSLKVQRGKFLKNCLRSFHTYETVWLPYVYYQGPFLRVSEEQGLEFHQGTEYRGKVRWQRCPGAPLKNSVFEFCLLPVPGLCPSMH